MQAWGRARWWGGRYSQHRAAGAAGGEGSSGHKVREDFPKEMIHGTKTNKGRGLPGQTKRTESGSGEAWRVLSQLSGRNKRTRTLISSAGNTRVL